MEQIQWLNYLVAVTPSLIVALACKQGAYPQFAEVCIPYHGPDGSVYGINCYLLGVPNHQVAFVQMLLLQQFAQLLAGRGGEDEQFEGVAALYKHGGTADVPALMEFRRPQDWATRGLLKEAPPWVYRRLLYIVTQDTPYMSGVMKAGTCYIVNSWCDVPGEAHEVMEWFSGAFPLMSMKTADDRPRPMTPQDCIDPEHDFWDRTKLGAPNVCPDDDAL